MFSLIPWFKLFLSLEITMDDMSHNEHSRNKLRRKYPLLQWPFASTNGTVRCSWRGGCTHNGKPCCL